MRFPPQQLYSSAALREVVILISIIPVRSGKVDEPFRGYGITVETNMAIWFKVGWKGEPHFLARCMGNLIEKISRLLNGRQPENPTVRLSKDFESE